MCVYKILVLDPRIRSRIEALRRPFEPDINHQNLGWPHTPPRVWGRGVADLGEGKVTPRRLQLEIRTVNAGMTRKSRRGSTCTYLIGGTGGRPYSTKRMLAVQPTVAHVPLVTPGGSGFRTMS